MSGTAPRICIIANPGSGKDHGAPVRDVLRPHLDRHPGQFEVRPTEAGQLADAVGQAVREGFPTIAAAGGDGTINAVASGLKDTDRRMGVLPMGTFNYVARGLGISEDLSSAVTVLVGGREQGLSLGEVNGHVFLNNASLGLYPAILQRRERVYRRWGRSRVAAFWSVLRTIFNFRKGIRLKITVDGEVRRMKTATAFIALSAYQLREFGMEGAESIESGQFALLATPDCGRLRLLWNVIKVGMRRAQKGYEFELICGRDIVIETRRKHSLVALDGERVRMEGPFRFRLLPDAVTVLVPHDAA